MENKSNAGENKQVPQFQFNFGQMSTNQNDNKAKQPTFGNFQFQFGSQVASEAKDGASGNAEKKKFVFNFSQPKSQAETAKVAAQFSKKIEKVDEQVLCEQNDVKGYFLETITQDDGTKGQQWTEYDVGLHVQLVNAKGENEKKAQKVFIVKLQIKNIQKPELGEEKQGQEQQQVQKVIVKMAPALVQFKRVKNGLQVTGHNYCLLDDKNQPQLKNYYFKLPDAFITKLKEQNIDIQ